MININKNPLVSLSSRDKYYLIVIKIFISSKYHIQLFQ